MKKYKVIVKVGNEQFCKWRCNNLVSFADFLDRDWKDWRYCNVFDNIKDSPTYRQQIGSFTKLNRPLSKVITF
jgi:hypothetical protein